MAKALKLQISRESTVNYALLTIVDPLPILEIRLSNSLQMEFPKVFAINLPFLRLV